MADLFRLAPDETLIEQVATAFEDCLGMRRRPCRPAAADVTSEEWCATRRGYMAQTGKIWTSDPAASGHQRTMIVASCCLASSSSTSNSPSNLARITNRTVPPAVTSLWTS